MNVLAIKYSKISVNIPVELLKEFDKVCELHSYSRAEAIKEAVRQFIIDQMPEDYHSPQMKQMVNETIREQSAEWIKGMAQAAADPEVQKLQVRAAQQGVVQGMRAGIEQRFQDEGVPLSEEQKLQLAERLSITRLKAKETRNKLIQTKEKTRKKI